MPNKDRGEDVTVAAICSKIYAARAHLAANAALTEPPSESTEDGCCSINRCANLSAAAITAAMVAAKADENAVEALTAVQKSIGDEPSSTMANAVTCLDPATLEETLRSYNQTGRGLVDAVCANLTKKAAEKRDAETQADDAMIVADASADTSDKDVGHDDDNIEIDDVE